MRPCDMTVGMLLVTLTAAAAPGRDTQEAINGRVRAALARVASSRTERTVTGMQANAERVPCYAKFEVDMPQAGRIIAELYRYGAGHQLLTFKVDGQTVKQFRLQGKTARDLPRSEVWFDAPVPAGRHAVSVSNEGRDWINIRRYFFVFPLVSAAGMVSASGRANQELGVGFAYLANRSAGQLYRELLKREPCDLENLRIRVAVRQPGAYRVEVIDPVTGSRTRTFTAQAGAGTLTFSLPKLSTSAVLRWERADR